MVLSDRTIKEELANGRPTLEISNLARLPTPADRLCAPKSLGNKYQDQTIPTASRFHQDSARRNSDRASRPRR
jgi:hypothetical protein